jgi:tellurite resistance protein TerC
MPIDLHTIYVIVMVIFLEGILSIDNAAVLGAMVSGLPTKDPVPWPAPLRFLTNPIHRIFGGQQGAALKVGLLGAYVGRGLMLVLANFVIQNQWLKLLGAIYLIKLAFDNLGQAEPGEEAQVEEERIVHQGFWNVVVSVELADLAFSLDNVVAVVALSDELWLVMFGVFMGILTMRFAAGIFTWMILKEPILKIAAYIVVFNIGCELLLSEFFGIEVDGLTKFMISAGTLILSVVYAHVTPLHVLRPVFIWLGEGMSDVNELIDWAIRPIVVLIRLLFRLIVALVGFVIRPLRRRNPSSRSGEVTGRVPEEYDE